ncbi:uncharacterized protein JCM6883_002697 [Sporobolomyces salmoneus]|uniref:uncharacterized protein n=1 Tax=Sporobolomyces salmoneus TaxID=183962 RepID=UPI00316BCE52
MFGIVKTNGCVGVPNAQTSWEGGLSGQGRVGQSALPPLDGYAGLPRHVGETGRADQVTKGANGVTTPQLCRLLENERESVVVLDTRSLDSFLGDQGRIRHSINVSFPSLLCKRLANHAGKSLEAFKLEDFITTSLGKTLYRGTKGRTVVIVDDKIHQSPESAGLNPGRVLLGVLEAKGEVKDLYYLDRELGEAAKGQEELRRWVVWGENEDESTNYINPRAPSSPFNDIRLPLDTPTLTAPRSTKPRIALGKLDTSSNLLAPHSRPGVSSAAPLSTGLTASVESPTRFDPESAEGGGGISNLHRKAPPPRLNLEALNPSLPRTPSKEMSLHEICHLQAKSPPAEATRFLESDLTLPCASLTIVTPARPFENEESSPPPFEASTIIPDFLYLGQEPTCPSDFSQLSSLGITEILNLAVECRPLPPRSSSSTSSETDSDSEDERGRQPFIEKYYYLPLRDSIEETGVQAVLDQSCSILDSAKLRGTRVYVHCFLGRSRSCMVVLAYLMHLYQWHLQRAYNYVVARREKISPNLGFMAELMSFEERTQSSKPASNPLASLHRSKSALQPLTRSSRLLVSSPISTNLPQSESEPTTAKPSPTTTTGARTMKMKLERGTSDLGPMGSVAASSMLAQNTSRAVKSLLTAENDNQTEFESGGRGEKMSRGSSTEGRKDLEGRGSRLEREEIQEIASYA